MSAEVRDQELMEQIQYAFVQPPDRGLTWPSGLWTRDEVLKALDYRQQRLSKETHFQVGISEVDVVAGTTRPTLPAECIAVVRLGWITTAGRVWSPIDIVDSLQADYGLGAWGNEPSAVPKWAMLNESPTLTCQLTPAPALDGVLEVTFVPGTVPLDGEGDDGLGEVLTVPRECAHGVKYGAMAQLLRKAFRVQDAARAAYCDMRYDLVKTAIQLILEGGA